MDVDGLSAYHDVCLSGSARQMGCEWRDVSRWRVGVILWSAAWSRECRLSALRAGAPLGRARRVGVPRLARLCMCGTSGQSGPFCRPEVDGCKLSAERPPRMSSAAPRAGRTRMWSLTSSPARRAANECDHLRY